MENKINFTVGPVQMDDETRKIGMNQIPYFRTSEFSNLMLENEELIKKFSIAPENSRAVFMTGSGTASMEATVLNCLTKDDKVLVVNGGSFGKRFVELLKLYEIPHVEIKMNTGEQLTSEILEDYNNKDFTAFMINIHETSTGVRYDLDLIGNFCKKNNLLLIVDSISSFLADEIDMTKNKIDVLIIGSQKALACPPGISIIVLSESAINKIYKNDAKCYYLNLKSALENQKRGQTPFTPAVGILIQINNRLKLIDKNGGVKKEIEKTKHLAEYFRSKINNFPFKMVTDFPSNAVTSLYSLNNRANEIFLTLKDNYNIWVCPNGGELKDKIFRVGHIGHLTEKDYDELINALEDMNKKGLL